MANSTASYSEAAISELLYLLEEEKLAGDIYDAFFDLWGLDIFANIARSEDSHFNALLRQAQGQGLDLTAILAQPAGSYTDAALQALYDTLLAQGSQSATAALSVGVLIEETDIVDLQRAADLVPGTPLAGVYDNLLGGSESHLVAFNQALDGALPEQLVGGGGDDSLTGTEGADTIFASAGDDTVTGGVSDADRGDLISGGTGQDLLTGGAGDDTVIGGAGQDTVDGGTGIDMLFGDGLDYTTSAAADQVFRLYQATLDRLPDAGGYADWTIKLSYGIADLTQLAGGFVSSPEFESVYIAITDADFVTLLYNNVLDRAPDAGGLDDWVARLQGGTTRSEVVVGFAESTEFVASTAAAADAFAAASMAQTWTDDVYRLYLATLCREADAGGFTDWVAQLTNGTDYLSVVGGFVNSAEFQQTYGTLDNSDFVTLLYDNVLNRAPDAQGLAGWVGQLDTGGLSRTEVVRGFAQSTEFEAATQTALTAFMRGLGTDDVIRTQAPEPDLTAQSDTVYGGAYADRFELAGGSVVIADFEDWDVIATTRGSNATGAMDVADFLAVLQQDGDDVTLSLAETWDPSGDLGLPDIRILNAQVADFTVDHFDFIGA
ncbi:DUF4214 domain-containing protein [Mesobacterium sp. TK19101]|uniref:DUF4214 domain-containing protein n=1 Tax=Mesobacterium hydrothermale TaxID=3111907 RepID=A0ABU6HJM2_9RHOB|nr:DUF4214 domain-containing protein [Mesobacterium sp. TK19101]MEC3862648.1 DUF4214 domain-containing protein [Mesobacterium sp. TK19101]